MGIKFVEHSFNGNDYFIIAIILLSYLIIYYLPRLFNNFLLSFLLQFYGIMFASLFDNTVGAAPFDYYDIMDGPDYTIMDVFAYFIYGPFGYIFIYFYEKWKVQGKRTIIYVLVWTCIGISIEWINVKFGVFTYKSGYKPVYSIPIYLFTQSFLLIIYKYIATVKMKFESNDIKNE